MSDPMTDDELRRHLARRADAEAGWPRHTILSSVAMSIGDRTQPVTRRGVGAASALAAVAAVIVLMVGLAIIPSVPPAPGATQPSQTASPADAAPTNPPAASIIECRQVALTPESGARRGPRLVLPVVDDRTGLVERCTLAGGRDDIGGPAYSVANPGNDATKLLVSWQGTPCDRAATVRFEEEAGEFHVVIELRGGDCEAMLVSHGVTLDLAKPLPAGQVAVRRTLAVEPSTTGTDVASSSVGPFRLRLSAPRSTYRAHELIEGITAELTYDGGSQVVAVVGTGQLIYGFSTEMLDGPYATGAGVDEPCVPDHITRGEPIVQPYEKSGGYDPDRPYADFYDAFFADPELRLPAGTWRITAYSEFYLGECGGESVELKASIVLDVLGDARPAATPSPPVSATPSPTVAPTPSREPLPTPLDNMEPYWELAPAERPTATSTFIDVLVQELRCSSGLSVEDRITGVEVLYGPEAVTITVGVRPLRGDRSCEPAPPSPITVELDEPLGNRRLVDGGSGLWVVWEHTDSFLGLTVGHSPTYQAEERLATRAGRACALSLERSGERPTRAEAEAEAMANEAPEGYGLVGDGRAWLGDWRDAAHAFGALEAYGWEFERLFMGVAAGQAWLHVDLPAGTLFVTDLYPIEVSAGRTLWVPNVDRLSIPPTNDEECPR